MEFLRNLTPAFFDTLVIVVTVIGLALAVVRLYSDFTRPLPSERSDTPQQNHEEQIHKPRSDA